MCGIAGELSFRRAPDREAVDRMTDSMSSRGPDGEGHWQNDWVALGHRRLSIIDLSDSAAQPMVDDDLGLVLVFNGCIYNHAELRRELQGYTFRSDGDTEVILKAYDRWGEDFVDHLVGMFALAIVDLRRQRVVFARDRLGIKPLYLAEVGGALRFASTAPALLTGGGVDTAVDDVALHHYLSWHSIVPAPLTILRGVRKVPPATVLVVERDGTRRERQYWAPRYERDPERAGWSSEDWADAIHDATRTAVKRRLVADVPVGVLLSGGVDSSLIVALMAELGRSDTETFSIGFEDGDADGDGDADERGDEFEYSDLIARTFGTRHHRIRVSTTELESAVRASIGAMSEPMGSHDVAAFYGVADVVSDHISVVQSGQGADEVFAGYGYHLPSAGVPRDEAWRALRKAFVDLDHETIATMVSSDHLIPDDASEALLESHLAADGAATALDAVLRLDTHLLMPDDPVKRVDNMTMAWGVEARVPFLDHELVELAASCPPELKASDGGKGVLKRVARRVLPAEVIDRRKGYFPVPVVRNPTGPVLALAREALTSPAARERGLFQPEYLQKLLEAPGRYRTAGGASVLWQLAVLESWLQHHGV